MSVMNEPELGSRGAASAQSRADGSGRRAGTGRAGTGAERSLRCVPMSCGVVYSLYVDCCVSIADAPLDYVATLLVMTGLE